MTYLFVLFYRVFTVLDLNLVDWSSTNVLAVALGNSVYLWNAETGSIDHLLELEGADYVCSVSWIQEGNYVAVGTSLGNVQVLFIFLVMYSCFFDCRLVGYFLLSYGMSHKTDGYE